MSRSFSTKSMREKGVISLSTSSSPDFVRRGVGSRCPSAWQKSGGLSVVVYTQGNNNRCSFGGLNLVCGSGYGLSYRYVISRRRHSGTLSPAPNEGMTVKICFRENIFCSTVVNQLSPSITFIVSRVRRGDTTSKHRTSPGQQNKRGFVFL